jgi:hypothetical protein
MSTKRFTPEKIESLNKGEVFVFGSNIQGEHVGGAAAFANKVLGAEMGCGFGFCDFACKTYAIPTCIRVWAGTLKPFRATRPFENVNQIKPFVDAFISDAKHYADKTFYVTKVGCGIASFKISEIAELFRPCLDMDNVILPKEFIESLLYPIVIDNMAQRGFVGGRDYDDSCVMAFVMERICGIHSLDDILDEFERLPYI